MDDKRVSSISKSETYEEMAEFWETHSLADYADQTYEVEMTFDPAARRTQVGIDPDLFNELRQIAGQRHISTQTLVNLWLSERVMQLKTLPAQ
ncbi:MAG TPA: CopG family antitoxin [Anaerolineae bacterium]|nr:CopG family antitoxin [Anaerolineae bacterium]